MKYIMNLFFLYAAASCVACLIHMWRNRKNRETVLVYWYTFLLELILVIALLTEWR